MKQQNEKREYIRPELVQLDMGIVIAEEGISNQGNPDTNEGDDFEG